MGIATLSKEMYSTLGKYPYWLFCTFSTSAFVVVVVVVVFDGPIGEHLFLGVDVFCVLLTW